MSAGRKTWRLKLVSSGGITYERAPSKLGAYRQVAKYERSPGRLTEIHVEVGDRYGWSLHERIHLQRGTS